MVNTELLEAAIRRSGYKKGFIAEFMGLSTYGLTRKIRNESEFKTSEVKKLCNLLCINDFEEMERIFFA